MNRADQELRTFWRRSVWLAHCIVLAGAVLLYCALTDGRALALGLLLGGATGILRFRLSYRAMVRGRSAGALVRTRLMTYALSALALGLAFWRREQINPWTTAIGLFVMNGSILLTEMLSRRGKGAEAPAPDSVERRDDAGVRATDT